MKGSYLNRNLAIDTLRGIAIVLMILSNFTGEHLLLPHPMLLRILGSFAPPIFIVLCGFMLGLSKEKKQAGFGYFLKRSAIVVCVALGVDVLIWREIPFLSVDVLHLIGVGILFVYFFLKLPRFLQWVVVFGMLFLTPYLQPQLGFIAVPTFIEFACLTPLPSFQILLNHWIVDGGFPLFPWLSCLFFGAILVPLKDLYDGLKGDKKLGVIAGVFSLFVVACMSWILNPVAQRIRDNYSELFYPPTFGFVVSMMLMVVLGVLVLEPVAHRRWFSPFRILGRHSLLLYVVHLVLIVYVMPEKQKLPLSLFLCVYIFLMFAIWMGLYIKEVLRKGPSAP
ncbi:MAG: DUF1624 domain-containing protein [Candidatus Margulisbacteria bacterium]|nr:DUF1624 domain-containing protein [Candidatus Margulisiibacteriota bacterium]